MSTDTSALMVGVDVGGTKIAAGVVDRLGQVRGQVQVPTVTGHAEGTLQSIAAAIAETLKQAGVSLERISGIGLGIPGEVDRARGLSRLAVNLGWRDVPVKNWLEERLYVPCVVDNDVSAAALGESLYGAGKGHEGLDMVYLSLGTGIAARMVLGGRVYHGQRGLAGEIGHAVFEPGGALCQCGARGCLEALAAGPALARRALEALQDGQASSLQAHLASGTHISTELVCEAARQGDALAASVLAAGGELVAEALALLALMFDPQMIVLGGGLALEEGPYIQAIRQALTERAAHEPILRRVLSAEHFRLTAMWRDAGILGAAALVAGEHERGGV